MNRLSACREFCGVHSWQNGTRCCEIIMASFQSSLIGFHLYFSISAAWGIFTANFLWPQSWVIYVIYTSLLWFMYNIWCTTVRHDNTLNCPPGFNSVCLRCHHPLERVSAMHSKKFHQNFWNSLCLCFCFLFWPYHHRVSLWIIITVISRHATASLVYVLLQCQSYYCMWTAWL